MPPKSKSSKPTLYHYAKLFGWSYQSTRRARARGWNLDDYPSLLALAANAPGPRLPLKKLQALVGKTMPARPVPALGPDHYEAAIFSLQPAYARLWTATQRSFKQFKLTPDQSTRNLWAKFRTALTQLMKDVPDVDQGLRNLLEITDVDQTAEKALVWFYVLLGSLTRHILARPEFKKIKPEVKGLLGAEITIALEHLSVNMRGSDPSPKLPAAQNPITDLLALATEERAAYADFAAAVTMSEQSGRQAIYLTTLNALKGLAKEIPNSVRDLCHSKSKIEAQWVRACSELVSHLRSIGSRLATGSCFVDFNPVTVRLILDSEVEELFARHQRGEEPSPWGDKSKSFVPNDDLEFAQAVTRRLVR
jgi:hypothetical protein